MLELLIATANHAKVREFREMLGESGIRWFEAARQGKPPQVEETGKTFRANACLKAAEYARHYHNWAMADDSGLEVDALQGKPGVHSARWAELHQAGSGDADNNRLLLKQLDAVSDRRRRGRFICVLALSDPVGRIVLSVRESVEGRILRQQRGRGGFGYDPLFLIEALGKTTAELESDQKHAISHRGKALRGMKRLMQQLRLPAVS